MSRSRISGWGLLIVLAALPAVLWMGSGAAREEDANSAGPAVSSAGFAGDGLPVVGGAAASDPVGGLASTTAAGAFGPESAAGAGGVGLGSAVSTQGGGSKAAAGSSDLALLYDWLTGSFSSAAQSAADTSYSDLRLHAVGVWPQRSDAHWLYVEQAVASHPDKPYRMRVYRLAQLGPDLYESRVYKLPGEARFAGAWRKSNPLGTVTPDSLLPRAGCSLVLRHTPDGVFMGSTLGHDSERDLRGAAYATSDVRVEAQRMLSWDRGFDGAGKQVWGSEKGPYEFLRVKE
jgi:CpeT protein